MFSNFVRNRVALVFLFHVLLIIALVIMVHIHSTYAFTDIEKQTFDRVCIGILLVIYFIDLIAIVRLAKALNESMFLWGLLCFFAPFIAQLASLVLIFKGIFLKSAVKEKVSMNN